MLDPITVQKFILCGDKPAKELSTLIDLDNVEQKFGGNFPDIK